MGVCIALFFTAIAAAFWFQDLRYSQPTPRPPGLVAPGAGEKIALPASLFAAGESDAQQPIFLHFFNPDCPCSRFNAEHVTELYQQHGKEARFVAIVQSEAQAEAVCPRAAQKLGGMTAIIDREGEIAAACGVYSTPQAVVIAADGRLLYRGNYNLTRYCAEPATEFARVALEAALAHTAMPALPPAAGVAYGCELPAFTAAANSSGR